MNRGMQSCGINKIVGSQLRSVTGILQGSVTSKDVCTKWNYLIIPLAAGVKISVNWLYYH
jgi:hypothetical protein